MPPKKKEDDVDLSTLPPWLPIAVSLVLNGSKERSQKILDELTSSTYSLNKFITRNDIINSGKEKGLYADPSQAGDKQKKPSTDAPTELTPALLAKIFVNFYTEINIAGRKVTFLNKYSK